MANCKDFIARGLAARALDEISSVDVNIQKLTTADRIASKPTNAIIVYDTDIGSYFGWNLSTQEWIDLGTLGIPKWGAIEGNITEQTDLVNYLISTNITETSAKQFVSLAEKQKWNGISVTFIVDTFEDLAQLDAKIGDLGIVFGADKKPIGYLFDGDEWRKTSDPAWENINLHWANIVDAPNFDWGNF